MPWGEIIAEGSPGTGEYLQTNRKDKEATKIKEFGLITPTPVYISYKGRETTQMHIALL